MIYHVPLNLLYFNYGILFKWLQINYFDLDHEVEIDMSIPVEIGTKPFGKCKRVGRKTCNGIKGISKGTNLISYTISV